VQPTPLEDIGLELPVISSCIALDRRVDAQIRASSATDFPSLAVEGMGTVTTEKPCIMEGDNCRNLVAEEWEGTEIEVAAMEVVAVKDIGGFRCYVQ